MEDFDQYLRLEVQQLDEFMETTLQLLVVEELPLIQTQLESIIIAFKKPLDDAIDDGFVELLHAGGTAITSPVCELPVLLILDVGSLLLQLQRGVGVIILLEQLPIEPQVFQLCLLLLLHRRTLLFHINIFTSV